MSPSVEPTPLPSVVPKKNGNSKKDGPPTTIIIIAVVVVIVVAVLGGVGWLVRKQTMGKPKDEVKTAAASELGGIVDGTAETGL